MLQDGSGPVVRTGTPLFVLAVALFATVPLSATPDGVRVSTTVTDRQGKPVAGLTLKDFELREDGVVQKLVAVDARRANPPPTAILRVSEGFAQEPRRPGARGLPDVGIVERFANRYDVPVYAFDPRSAYAEPDGAAVMLGRLVSETGGTLSRGDDLAGNLARASL